MANSPNINFRLPADKHARSLAAAAAEGRTLSGWLQRLINQELARLDRQRKRQKKARK